MELFKQKEAEFVREAKRFLSAVRCGHSDERAAARAKVTMIDVRTWVREPAFAEAYRRAKRGKGKARVINPYALLAQRSSDSADPQWIALPHEREASLAARIEQSFSAG